MFQCNFINYFLFLLHVGTERKLSIELVTVVSPDSFIKSHNFESC